MVVDFRFSDESDTETGFTEVGPPRIVHTNMAKDVEHMAKGLRIAHRDAMLAITQWSRPESVLPRAVLELHGLEFCRRVINWISNENHEEVSKFAAEFSNQFKDNPRQLLYALSQPVHLVFSREEQDTYGYTFLDLVMQNCRQAMKCLEGLQRAQRTGAIPEPTPQPQTEASPPQTSQPQAGQPQTDMSRSTRQNASRKPADASRSTPMDFPRGTQTDITSDILPASRFDDKGRRVISDGGPTCTTVSAQKRIMSAPERLHPMHGQRNAPGLRTAPILTTHHSTDRVPHQQARAHGPQYALQDPYNDGRAIQTPRFDMGPNTSPDPRYARAKPRDGYGFAEAYRNPDLYAGATPFRQDVGAGNLQSRPYPEQLASGPQHPQHVLAGPYQPHPPAGQYSQSTHAGPYTQHALGGQYPRHATVGQYQQNAPSEKYQQHVPTERRQMHVPGGAPLVPASYHRWEKGQPTVHAEANYLHTNEAEGSGQRASFSKSYVRGTARKYSNRGGKTKNFRRDSIKHDNEWSDRHHDHQYPPQKPGNAPDKHGMPGNESRNDQTSEPFPDFKENYPAGDPPRQSGDLVGESFIGENVDYIATLFVGNIPRHITAQDVLAAFADKAPIVSMGSLVPDRFPNSHHCFVTFRNTSDARRALMMDGAVVGEAWTIRIRVPIKSINHPEDYHRRWSFHSGHYGPGRRSNAGSRRGSVTRRGSRHRYYVEDSSGEGKPHEKVGALRTDHVGAVGDVPSAPAGVSHAESSDIIEKTVDDTEIVAKYYIPHTPETSVAGQFRSRSVVYASATSEGSPYHLPSDLLHSPNLADRKREESQKKSAPEQARLGSGNEQDESPGLGDIKSTPKRDQTKKRPKPLVLEDFREPHLPVLERKPRDQEDPRTQSDQMLSAISEKAALEENEVQRAMSVSPTVDIPPQADVKNVGATEPAAGKIERREGSDETASKTDRPSSPRPKDDWMNPFARQKALEKQQKQAAKNQKKKEKKLRQPSKGAGLKQKQDERSDAETAEGEEKSLNPKHDDSKVTDGEKATTFQGPSVSKAEEKKVAKKAKEVGANGQDPHAVDRQRSTAEKLEDRPLKYAALQAKVEQKPAVDKSKAKTGKSAIDELSQRKLDEKTSRQFHVQANQSADATKVNDQNTPTDKSLPQGKAAQGTASRKANGKNTASEKVNDQNTPTDKSLSNGEKGAIAGDKPAAKNHMEYGSAEHEAVLWPYESSESPLQCRQIFEYESPSVMDAYGRYKSHELCRTIMDTRGRSLVEEEVYPQSLQFNSVGFPTKNLVVRDTDTIRSHVPKMMPRQNERDMAFYKPHIRDLVPACWYAGGSASVSWDEPIDISSPEHHAGRRNLIGTPSKWAPIPVPPNTPANGGDQSEFSKAMNALHEKSPMLLIRNNDKPDDSWKSKEFADWDRTSLKCNVSFMRRVYSQDSAGVETWDDALRWCAGVDAKRAESLKFEADKAEVAELDCHQCLEPFRGPEAWEFCWRCRRGLHASCLERAWEVARKEAGTGISKECPLCGVRWKKKKGSKGRKDKTQDGKADEAGDTTEYETSDESGDGKGDAKGGRQCGSNDARKHAPKDGNKDGEKKSEGKGAKKSKKRSKKAKKGAAKTEKDSTNGEEKDAKKDDGKEGEKADKKANGNAEGDEKSTARPRRGTFISDIGRAIGLTI